LGEGAPREPSILNRDQSTLVDRFVAAFERYDVSALTNLLTSEAALCMPPYRLWLRGRNDIARWLLGRGSGCRGSRLVAVPACGAPAFAQYKQDGSPWALLVLDMARDGIGAMTFFLDTARLFPQFGLPMSFVGG
jgi:RNA polymerase sigma-70 factor (ECF subfamily)